MEKVKIYSQWENTPHATPEKPSGKSKYSQAGYQPAEEKIKSLLAAGKRLFEANTAAYDIKPGESYDIDEIATDPTKKQGFDLAEASQLMASVETSMKRSKEAQKALAQEAAKSAAEAKLKAAIEKAPEKGA